jgi:putative oxidoreductase
MDTGILIARVVFGLMIAVHGGQKLFGWFGGPGFDGTGALFEGLGFVPGRLFVAIDVFAECAGGVLLVAGLFEPAAAAAIIPVMIVAIVTVHWPNGLLALTNGIELPLLYLVAALSLALTGPGSYSLDAILGLRSWWTPPATSLAIAAGVAGGIASLGMRRPRPRGLPGSSGAVA